MALTKTAFYAYSGLSSSDVNDNAATYFLATFQEILEKKLGYRFSLQPVVETDRLNEVNDSTAPLQFVKVGAWQESGLSVKKGCHDETETSTLSSDPLVEGQDYLLFRYESGYKRLPLGITKPNPVVGIKLLCGYLGNGDFLRLYGTWGFSNAIPVDLEYFLYTALKNAIQFNDSDTNGHLESDGAAIGAVKAIKDQTTSITFGGGGDQAYAYARDYFTNFIDSPAGQKALAPYLMSLEKTIYIL